MSLTIGTRLGPYEIAAAIGAGGKSARGHPAPTATYQRQFAPGGPRRNCKNADAEPIPERPMALNTGTRLGPYEIVSAIGSGGMGEVYRARDTRLDRAVAIKVLPAHVAGDPDLKARFEREARTLAALSHPHICPVFDVGEAPSPQSLALSPQTIQYLVMEYLEGETLAQRLDRIRGSKDPRLPLGEALTYAIQIADALDKAHRKGIVHRDLKPGNVMLTTTGAARQGSPQAKLLDFGLAKLVGSPRGLRDDRASVAQGFSPASELAAAPTMSTPLTAHGSIVGTFQYMAPEQLEGQEADARTDIFAFGAVLHEMITGRRAFTGKSQASLISSIMTGEPAPVSTVVPVAPPALDQVVRTCLAKDPDERWQTAGDIERQLKWIAEGGVQVDRAVPALARRPRLVVWVTAALAALGIGTLAGVGGWVLKPDPARPVMRFAMSLAEGEAFSATGRHLVAMSPDGRYLAYVANQRLNLRAMDQIEPSSSARVMSSTPVEGR